MSPRRALGATVVLAYAGFGSACALVFPVQLVDTTDAADASPDGPGGAGPDAGDASGDAGPWCARFSLGATGFCDDFDTKAVVTDQWTFDDPGASSVAFSTAHVVSSPYSADMAIAADAGGCTQSHLRRSAGLGSPPAAKVHAEAEIYVDDSTPNRTAAARQAVYALLLAGGSCQLALSIDPINAFIWESESGGMSNAFHDLHVGMPEGSWYAVALDADRSTSPPSLTVTIDGNVVGPIAVAPACAAAGDVSTELGFMCYGSASVPSAMVHFYYDNVLTRAQ